ncbi:site-specific DNA-methyltransferase [uncultured Methanobrevibacter sp.]|uniref:site-specific DNA-methyltransferase n=1 Tax=uncultured Methanobrevibacter sp. TaxID=253161 RepID=UPI0025CC55CF|nr:site-specific DNA-methyltransferase [uncultured Methanobrevibacter sp.]
MENKLNGESFDIVEYNISKLKELFPEIVTGDNEVDIAALIDIFKKNGDGTVDDSEEHYQFNWWGKKKSKRKAKETTTKTLRPVKKDSKNWDTTQNIYIEGDNLDALKILLKSYTNKIKMIYIDPPYNTGKDFVYKDNLTQTIQEHLESTEQLSEEGFLFENTKTNGKYHSNWLNMIYPRLRLARNLLSENGCILISIDDNENVDLKKICDEIFGEENFVSQLIWKSKTGGANDSKFVAIDHEYILVYAKRIDKFEVNSLPYTDELLRLYNSKDEYFETRDPYRPMLLMQKGLSFSKSLTYPIEAPDGTILYPDEGGAIWRWSEPVLKKRIEEGYVEFVKKGNEWKIYTKQYLNVDYDGNKINRGKLLRSVISDIDGRKGIKDIQKLFDEKVFTNPKPTDLIKLFISVFSNKNDLIMDFFSGSATTAQAMFKVNEDENSNRNFILIQIPELILSDKDILDLKKYL